jgi:hypothetical protein
MKKLQLTYSNKKYEGLFSLFTQRSILMMFLKDVLPQDAVLRVHFEVDAWRYVFEKDISKSQLIKNLLKSSVNNLIALEVIDNLNKIRRIIDEVYKKRSSLLYCL